MPCLEDVDVALQQDDPDARGRQLGLAIVQVGRDVPEGYPDEETVDDVQHKLHATPESRRGGEREAGFRLDFSNPYLAGGTSVLVVPFSVLDRASPRQADGGGRVSRVGREKS